jgi:RNA polymerase sigma-70 factor (ECF subfamily)
LGECVSDKEDVEEAYEYTELVADINAFLSTLPTKKRNVFVRRYWYADSVSEIAARYNMSGFAVSMMINRLREKLRNYLTERGYEL